MMMGGGRGPAMLFQTETSKPKDVSLTLARFWEYFKHYKFVLSGVAALILVSAYLQVLTPDIIGQAVDCFISPATQKALGGANAPVTVSTNCWWAKPDANWTTNDFIGGLGMLVALLVGLQIL